MAFDFPTGPAVGQIYTAPNGITFRWDGNAWMNSMSASGTAGYVQKSGDTMLGRLTLYSDPIGPLEAVTKQYVDVYVGSGGGGGGGESIPPNNAPPLMDGVADPGVLLAYSRGDHKHPSDTSLLPKIGGTMTGALTFSYANPTIFLNKPASGQSNLLQGLTANKARWAIELGTSAAEGGANSGSDFYVSRYNDDGSWLASAFTINRATGNALFSTNLSVQGDINTNTHYSINGLPFASGGGIYQNISDRAGNVAIIIGNGGDPANYYRNTQHNFGAIAGAANWLTINSAGATVTGNLSVSGSAYSVNGRLWGSNDFAAPNLSAYVYNARMVFVADFDPGGTGTMQEPYGGAVITGQAVGKYGDQRVAFVTSRYRYLQLATTTWWTVSYA